MDGGAWWAAVRGVVKSQTRLSDVTFTFHFLALEKEMATHPSVLAWSIPGTGEPGGLPSMGSHRVRHDWSDLAAAAAALCQVLFKVGWRVFKTAHSQKQTNRWKSSYHHFEAFLGVFFLSCYYTFNFSSKLDWEARNNCWDFPDSPVVKNLHLHCRGHRFHLWSGN